MKREEYQKLPKTTYTFKAKVLQSLSGDNKKQKGELVTGQITALNIKKAKYIIKTFFENHYTFSRYYFETHIAGEYILKHDG